MSIVDRLRVLYDLDDARFQAGIRRMRSASDRFARDAVGIGGRAEGAFSGISKSAIAAAASVAGLGVALNKVRASTDAYKVIENQLRGIGQASDEATDKLLAMAIRTRTPIEDLATAVARIQKATGDGYDVTLRRVETLNKAMAVGGATAQEVSSVMTQLSQALTGGVLMGDEFASLRESAPVELLDAIAAAAGTTRSELRQFSEDGKLTADVVTKALDSMASSADASFGATSQTIGQAMTNINSAMTVFIGRVDEGVGSSEALISAMNDLSSWLVDNADEAVELGQSLGAMFDVANENVSAFLALLDSMADSLREALDAEPLEDFGDGVQRVAEFIAELNGVIEGAAAVSREAFLVIADNISQGLSDAINAVIGAVQGMINAVLAGVRAAAGAIDSMTAGAAALNNRLPAALQVGPTEGTNLAAGIQDVNLGKVGAGPQSSSGKSFGEIYDDASDTGARRVLDALEAQNDRYDARLTGRQIASQTPLQLGLPALPQAETVNGDGTSSAGGGASSSDKKGGGKGRKGRKGKKEDPFFENIQTDIVGLERQLELIGKTTEEAAKMKATWELLDEAKKRGIPVNETLMQQIDAQATQFGRLTGELERAEKSQQQFERAVDGIADAMAGALVAGESLRDGLANVLKGIASDILSSGIKEALNSQFGGGSGGGWLSAIAGIFGGGQRVTGSDSLSTALRGISGFRAGGGSVSAGRAYVVGENEPELFVPRVSGTILNGAQAARAMGAAGGGDMNIHVTAAFDESGNLYVKNVARMEATSAAASQGRASSNMMNQKTGSRRRN